MKNQTYLFHILIFLFCGSLAYANWRMNPFTGKPDYYEINGATITSHTGLTDIGTNTHAQIDSKLSLHDSDIAALKASTPTFTGTPDGTKFLRDDYTWQGVSANSLASGDYLNDVKVSSAIYADSAGNATTATTANGIASGNYLNNVKVSSAIYADSAGTAQATSIASGNYLGDVKVSSAIYSDSAGDADTVDGSHAAAFAASDHNHTGTYQPTGDYQTDLSTPSWQAYDAARLGGVEASGYSQTSHTHSQFAEIGASTATETAARIAADFAIGAATETEKNERTTAVWVNELVRVGSATIANSANSVAAANVQSGVLGATVRCSSVTVASVYDDALRDVKSGACIVVSDTQTFITSHSTCPVSTSFITGFTISTVTFCIDGGTSVSVRLLIRSENTQYSVAGTEVLSAPVLVAGESLVGGTIANASVSSGQVLVLVVDSIVGAVKHITVKVRGTR